MTRFERYIVYLLPLVSLLSEILRSFLGEETKVLAMRDHGIFLVILYLTIRYFKSALHFNFALIFMMVYFFAILVFQGFDLAQYNYFVRVFDAKMLLPLGFIFTSSYLHIKALNKEMLIVNILFVGSIIVFSILGIGDDQYKSGSGFMTGTFTFSKIYIGSYLLLILPIIYSEMKGKLARNAYILLGIATLIILVLSVRRTSVVIVLIGAMVYIYYYRNHISRIVLNAFLLFVVVFSTFPIYEDILMRQISARGDVFNDRAVTENLQGETRYKETLAVYNERILNHDMGILLFGEHLFASAGHYDRGIHKDRPLHLDTNIVLHGSGVVGLALLILFYILLYLKFYSLRAKIRLSDHKNLVATFLGMFLSHLFIIISGGMSSVTFNMISYLYMGATLGYFRTVIIARSVKHYVKDDSANLPMKIFPEIPVRKSFMYQPNGRSAARVDQ